MKILIDIGHPAHVHYFRNFISIMKSKGNEFMIVARNKEVVFSLLTYYNLHFIGRGSGNSGLIGKLIYLPQAVLLIRSRALKFKPDIFLSFASPYSALASWLLRKPHIAFDDTDHSLFEHLLYVPFTKTILTPKSYLKNFGSKHIRFDGYMEMCSLHPKYISFLEHFSENDVFDFNQKYVVIRLVSWKASHDRGLKGLSHQALLHLVEKLSRLGKVVISSEGDLPEYLEEYRYKSHPAMMHHLLYYASLFVGESLTMSAEAAFLGTPALCISSAIAGVTNEQIESGIYYRFEEEEKLIERATSIFSNPDFKREYAARNKKVLANKIDTTAFMVWFVQNYPQSIRTLKENPDFQYNFK